MKKASTILTVLAAHAVAGIFAVASMAGLTPKPDVDEQCCYPPPECAPWMDCWDDGC